MAWWVMVRQLVDDAGRPIGRYRLTAESDEGGGGPYGLCDCTSGHATPEEAKGCPKAKEEKARY
jgi:hypothetical protein